MVGRRHKNATRFEKLKYMDVLGKDLKVMDAAAISLARENNVPVIVFSIHEVGAFSRVVSKVCPPRLIQYHKQRTSHDFYCCNWELLNCY